MNNVFNPLVFDNPHARRNMNNKLVQAVRQNSIREARALIRQGASPNARTGGDEATVLMLACAHGNIAMARTLIDKGADPGLPDNDNATPLHRAAEGDAAELVQLLIKKGAALEGRTSKAQRTPLMRAAELGKAAALAQLLHHDADPDAATDTGISALHMSIISGSTNCVKLLLKHGADPMIATNKGKTAYAIARQTADPAIVEVFHAHFSLKHTNRLHNLRKKRKKQPHPA